MKKNAYVNTFEVIFESSDILANPFMDYTKLQLEKGFEIQEDIYKSSPLGSAPRRQAFSAMAHIEVAFDAYAKAIRQLDVYVDNDTTLRDILEDSYEIAHGVVKSVEDMQRNAGLPGLVVSGNEMLESTMEKTKDLSKKASNTLFDGIFLATAWLNKKTDPTNRN